MRWLKIILMLLVLTVSPVILSASEESSSQDVDVAHMLFGHIGDSYGWHIMSAKFFLNSEGNGFVHKHLFEHSEDRRIVR